MFTANCQTTAKSTAMTVYCHTVTALICKGGSVAVDGDSKPSRG
jgi:hypothetical protein